MFGVKKYVIANNERGLLFKDGNLKTILKPGRYRFFGTAKRLSVEIHDITNVEFQHRLAKYFVKAQREVTQHWLSAYELTDTQVGLVYVDGHLYDVLAPGDFAVYWKQPYQVNVEILDISEDYALPAKLVALIGHTRSAELNHKSRHNVHYVEVGENQVGLLMVNGKFEKVLATGSYAFWKFNRNVQVNTLDLRLTTLEINGQEILTKDKVSLRLNLTVHYQIVEPEKVALAVTDYKAYLYKELQLVLRDAVGGNTLDELLANKGELNQTVTEGIRTKAQRFGMFIDDVGVKDIILPGEMKTILNQVVEAEKQAQANLIKRREETAATRSLLNTAKMMDHNPVLLRLKELESLERITDKIGNITVFGGMDAVLQQLVNIKQD